MEELRVTARQGQRKTVAISPGVVFGAAPVIIAGPCSVESPAQMDHVARAIREAGAHMLRGGAYKPRTSPYSFQGLGEAGLKLLAEAGRSTGLPTVTEALDVRQVELVARYADMVQIGARSMHNVPLLREAARCGKPVMVKRSFSATIEEWLLAVEYVLVAGGDQVILCERGIRTFETFTRNTLDLGALVAVKQLTNLPVIADPSHATGRRELVPALARASLAAGADGLMIEVHPEPEQALSDGRQSLTLDAFTRMMASCRSDSPLVADTAGVDSP